MNKQHTADTTWRFAPGGISGMLFIHESQKKPHHRVRNLFWRNVVEQICLPGQ